MEANSSFDDMTYAELRRQAKQLGVKANLKTDVLRKELKRVSLMASRGDEEEEEEDRNVHVADASDRSICLSNLPTKTPAHVTRRKGSRVTWKTGAASRQSGLEEHVGAADQTMVDPLAEGRMIEETNEDALKPFISDDDEEEDTRCSSKKTHVDVSAYMSEEEEEGAGVGKTAASTSSDPDTRSERRRTFEMESPTNEVIRPPLARERTFEMESPSKEGIRPPLARERTFEMESPSQEGIRPPLARERTFEKDSLSLDPPGPSLTRRRTFELEAGNNEVPQALAVKAYFKSDIDAASSPSASSPVTEFSILRDETSGLSSEELKARIMASIAVSPSTLAAEATAAAASVDSSSRDGAGQQNGKSCSKDWTKIHSTNRTESLVDFYQRKRKRADEAQKSAQKSAKLSAAKRAAVAASMKNLAGAAKSARTLAFSKPTSVRPENGVASKPAAATFSSSSTVFMSNGHRRRAPPMKAAAQKAPVSQAPVTKRVREAASSARDMPSSKRARVVAPVVPKAAGSASKKVISAPKSNPAPKTNPTPKSNQTASSSSSKIKPPTPSRVKMVTPKGHASATDPTTSNAVKTSFVFKPTIFSTKDMNLNFGAADSMLRAACPVMKSGVGGGIAKTSAAPKHNSVAAGKGASLLPSLPKLDAQRRVSPRIAKPSVSVTSVTLLPSSSAKSTPNTSIVKSSTPLSRLAPSRTTTPGKRSAAGTPSTSNSTKITPRRSPWIPAGIAAPHINFVTNNGDTENVFKFTAESTAPQQQPAKKKFDLKESLKQKLKYKPHRGPLRAFEGEKGTIRDMKKKPFR